MTASSLAGMRRVDDQQAARLAAAQFVELECLRALLSDYHRLRLAEAVGSLRNMPPPVRPFYTGCVDTGPFDLAGLAGQSVWLISTRCLAWSALAAGIWYRPT